MQQPKEERNFALLPKHIQNQTQNLFKKIKIQLQTQKWVPKNSPHLTRNGVVSSFLNPQWLEGKPQTSKQQQQRKLRKERQVPKESTRREEEHMNRRRKKTSDTLRVSQGKEKHVLAMFWGQYFCHFSHQNLETIGNIYFIFKKYKFYYVWYFWDIFSSFCFLDIKKLRK